MVRGLGKVSEALGNFRYPPYKVSKQEKKSHMMVQIYHVEKYHCNYLILARLDFFKKFSKFFAFFRNFSYCFQLLRFFSIFFALFFNYVVSASRHSKVLEKSYRVFFFTERVIFLCEKNTQQCGSLVLYLQLITIRNNCRLGLLDLWGGATAGNSIVVCS